MLEVKGKCNTAKIFTDIVDEASVAQVIQLCSQEFTAGSRIRMMPHIHAGVYCTVGVDIGCGMETVRLRETHMERQKLDEIISS